MSICRARRAHPVGRHDLRVVLAATEQVDVERVGDRCARRNLEVLRVDPAAPTSLDEHDRVAAVAVRAEQLGIHEPDAHRGGPRHHDALVSAVNWVYDATMLTSPDESIGGPQGIGLDDVVDAAVVEPHRDIEGTFAAGGDLVAAQDLVRDIPEPRRVAPVRHVRVHREHDGGGLRLQPAQHLGPTRGVLGEQDPRVASIRQTTRGEPAGHDVDPADPGDGERRIDAEVGDRRGERQGRIHAVPVAGQRQLAA